MKLELHPLCSIFPRIVGEDFDSLKADIKANGLNHPIVLFEGMILDGANRYRACGELGIEADSVQYEGDNASAFVLSENLERRQLSKAQRAMVRALAQDWAKANPGWNVSGGNQYKKVEGDRDDHLPLVTRLERAKDAGVHEVTQRRADAVVKADPELAKRVISGELSMSQALRDVGKAYMAGGAGAVKAGDEPKKADPLAKVRDEVRAARKKGFPTALNHFAKQALSFIRVQSQEEVKFSNEEMVVLNEIAQVLSEVLTFQSIN